MGGNLLFSEAMTTEIERIHELICKQNRTLAYVRVSVNII
jgi:hypothetical protein